MTARLVSGYARVDGIQACRERVGRTGAPTGGTTADLDGRVAATVGCCPAPTARAARHGTCRRVTSHAAV